MHSILRNVVLLKIPLHKIKPNQLNVNNFTRSFGNESQKTSNLLRTTVGQNQGKPSLKTSHKVRRDYSKKTGKTSDQLKMIDTKKKKQRDEVHTEDCMTIKDGRVVKRKSQNQDTTTYDKLLENEDYDPTFFIYETEPIPEIKEVVDVNSKIRHEKKERTRLDRHFINKVFHPINKREKKLLKSNKNSEKQGKLPSFKPLKKYFSTAKRTFSKHEAKKRQFQKQCYEDAVVPEEHRDMYPYFVEKLNKAEASKNKRDTQRFPLLKTKKKESLPLFMIVKEMSEKSKAGHKNLVYKVCNNMASYNDKKPVLYDPNVKIEPKRDLQKSSSKEQLPKVVVGNRENFFCAPEKCKGKITNFYSLNSRNLTVDEDYKEKLTRTIRYLLQPVIEQEYMKYNELRSTLERMEKNMDTFFKQTKYTNEQDLWGRSLEVQNRQNDFVNIFDKGITEIRDPTPKQEIKDPMELKNEHKDPTKRSAMTVPCYRKEKIQDPNNYGVMIAKDDSNKNKNPCPKFENPCPKKEPCEPKEPIQKEKEEPCKEEKPICMEEDSFKKAKSKAAIFVSSESCDEKQTAASEPMDPFKKSKSKATSFMPAGTQPTECFFAKDREQEPVDPFKKAKSKSGSFYPPGGVDGKDHCDEGIQDQKNVPFKTVKHKKEAFVSEQGTEPCVDPCKHQVPCKPPRLDEQCLSLPDFGKSKRTGKSSCCDRDSCTSISHDKLEIPACCRVQSAPKVGPKKNQLPCSTDHPKPKETVVARPPPPPPEPPKKCPIHTAEEKRYCKKAEKQQEQPKVVPAPKGYMKACRVPPPPPPPDKSPRFLEPRQYEKKTWTPVKLKGRKPKTRKSRSEPTLCRADPTKSSVSKSEDGKKGFLDGCKGLFATMCKMFCPGKSGAGKKGAAIGAATSQSMPELRNYSQYKTADQGDGHDRGKSKKKKAFKEKYPWKKAERPPCTITEKFFNSKSKEKFHEVKKSKPSRTKPLPLCEQVKNEEKPKEQQDKTIPVSLCDQVKKTKTGKEENHPKKKPNKKQAPHKLCMKMSAFGDVSKRNKCFKASRNHRIIASFQSDHRQYSQSKSSRSSKIRKKYPWAVKIEKGTLEDCTKNSLITQLAMKKQVERELEEKAMEMYYQDLTASRSEEPKLETEDNVECDKEEDLKIVQIIKEEVEAKNETLLEQQPENMERKSAALCQSEDLQKNEKAKHQAAPSSKERPSIIKEEKPKVQAEICFEKNQKKESSKEVKSGITAKCEEESKTKKKGEKCLEKNDQSPQKQCVELCVTPAPVKKIPYKEDKGEKCYDPQFLICEVKKMGNCEQLICKPMKKPQALCDKKTEEKKEEKQPERVLKCKVVQDDCNRQCLVCKEINPGKEFEEEAKNQIANEEKKCKDKSKHKKKDKMVTISKKLVCKEEVIPLVEAKEMTCKPMEVREIKDEGKEKQKKFAKVGKKVSPFTYQDLLKKSEEVRREAEKKLEKKKEDKKPSC